MQARVALAGLITVGAIAFTTAVLIQSGTDPTPNVRPVTPVASDAPGTSPPSGEPAADVAGASSTSTGPVASALPTDVARPGDFVVGGDGELSVTVHVPDDYDPTVAAPLLIMLHGATESGASEEAYMQLGPVAAAKGMLYLAPNGHQAEIGGLLWNATDACCDLSHSGVDDSGYLESLITEIRAKVSVDPKRIYFMGHSNGGFMSYRMACDHAADVAAIVSLSGATFADPAACAPTEPVSVLEIHGTSDQTIHYAGGVIDSVPYPSAQTTVETWATYNGCSPVADTPAPPTRAVTVGPAAEVESFSTGCRAGGHVELWTLPGGIHKPPLITPAFAEQAIDYLLAHPKP